MAIECLVLGAGQEVGKSCVVVSINGKRIMFDCGMHMGYADHRRYPDFSLISKSGDFDDTLSCVIITHFHLDHIGALPYFTEVCGYNGPIYMTYPTKALAPLMLEDYRKVMVGRGEEEQFTYENILDCMKKVTAVDLKQTVQVDKDLQVRAYYAGHVLGAAMFYASMGDAAMVYTGDYNMTPDRHLGAAQIDRMQLDVLITESTYATTIRDSKYAREREFLKAVHKCVANGGKVLIPTFALGRAQELCILLDDYWERMNLKVPIYFSAGKMLEATRKHLYWTPCAAHCIDLMLEDIGKQIPRVKSCLKKAMFANGYIYNFVGLVNLMWKFTNQRNLHRPAITRFATSFITLLQFHKQKNNLRKMVISQEWMDSKWSSEPKGKMLHSYILQETFWRNIVYALKLTGPLVSVLRLVDGERKPAMGYIYEAMDRAKEAIAKSFPNQEDLYKKAFEIIDNRWECQLHRPLHAAGHYLNPSTFYDNAQRVVSCEEVMEGLHSCIERLAPSPQVEDLILRELGKYQNAEGLFGRNAAIRQRKAMAPGLTMQANLYYKVLINWTSQKVKDTYATRNAFDFKNVHSFDRSLLDAPGPCVLFATPGMISGGFSLEVFKHWAPSEANLITLPGYCVAGTVGHKLMSGKPTKVDLDKDTQIDVRCQIHQLSFSPHTDAKGIMDLVKFLSPKHVVLVHGEKPKMDLLKARIKSELGIQCYDPANTETVSFPSTQFVKADASNTFIRSSLTPNFKFLKDEVKAMAPLEVCDERVTEGILAMEKGQKVKILHQDELLTMLGTEKAEVEFGYCFALHICSLKRVLPAIEEISVFDENLLLSVLNMKLSNEVGMQDRVGSLEVNSFRLSICKNDKCPHRRNGDGNGDGSSEGIYFCCNWSNLDMKLAWRVISLLKNMDSGVDL